MKHITHLIIAIMFCLFANIAKADLVDSIANITVWEVADGGNGHVYGLMQHRTTWDSIFVAAPNFIYSNRHGYLATITSQEENDFILNNVVEEVTEQHAALEQFFLGGLEVGGQWTWISGETYSFENWAPTEPNNPTVEIVMAIWGFGETDYRRPAGTWNNTLPNVNINPYILQWSIIEWDEPVPMETNIELPSFPIHAAMKNPLIEAYVRICIGNFPGFHDASDVNPNTMMVNGEHFNITLDVVSNESFIGDALEILVPIQEFGEYYFPFRGNKVEEYTVTGTFEDGTLYSVSGSFTALGHNPGDVNLDGAVNNRDLLYMINRIFRNGPPPENESTADVNGSCGKMDVKDLLYMINYIFRNGPAPVHCTE